MRRGFASLLRKIELRRKELSSKRLIAFILFCIIAFSIFYSLASQISTVPVPTLGGNVEEVRSGFVISNASLIKTLIGGIMKVSSVTLSPTIEIMNGSSVKVTIYNARSSIIATGIQNMSQSILPSTGVNVPVSPTVLPSQAYKMRIEIFPQSWFQDWGWRKSHTINSATGAGTGYQIKIIVHYGIGTDSGQDVYLNGHSRSDFGDVRFTDNSMNPLSYWIENGSLISGVSATFWVKINNDLSTTAQTIYIYYGEPGATTTSNGDTTFLFFDEFSGTMLNATKWSQSGGTAGVSSSVCTFVASTTTWQAIVSADSFGPNARWRCSGQLSIAGLSGYYAMFGLATNADPTAGNIGTFYASSGTNYVYWGTASGHNTAAISLNSAWHTYEMDWLSGSYLNLYTDDALTISESTSIPTVAMSPYAAAYASGSSLKMNWVFVSKFAGSEPTQGAWGTEEAYSTSWLKGWTYRKGQVINNATGAGTGYQIEFTVHYGSGTDSSADVYLNGKCRTDFSDVRFTASDGITQLSYWIQTYTASSTAIFWVKVAGDLSSTNQTVYIYYGNSPTASLTNGVTTFLLFDDFLGSTLNTTMWYGDCSAYVQESYVKLATAGSSWVGMLSYASFGPNIRFLSRSQLEVGASGVYDSVGLSDRIDPSTANMGVFHWSALAGQTYSLWGTHSSPGHSVVMSFDGNWHTFEIDWVGGTSLKWFSDSTLLQTSTTYVPTASMGVVAEVYGYGSWVNVDWVALTKFVDPGPAHGAWELEESRA
jgi:hypothetical protein